MICLKLRLKLRKGLAPADCESAFVCAAAWLAAAALESGRCVGGGIASVRAGDLTVEQAGAREENERVSLLRKSARLLMQPYCVDESFCFRSVRG